MLSKCLNPQCTAKFRYLGEGRLFRIDFPEMKRRNTALAGQVPALCNGEKERPVEHVWLCAHCAAGRTLAVSDAGEVRLVPLPVPQEPTAAEPPEPKLVAAS